MEAKFYGFGVEAVVGLVPNNISFFDDEVVNYPQDNASSEKLKKVMGYSQHRIESGGRTVSDYACHMLEVLRSEGVCELEQLDAVVVVTQTPDFFIPPTSCVIHGRLGLRREAYTIDINDGCAGYVKGLAESAMLLAATDAKLIALVAGDVLSGRVSRQDRNSYPLIGDAVTVTLIRKWAAGGALNVTIETNGSGADALMIPAGGVREPSSEETRRLTADVDGNVRSREQLVMKGGDVFAFTQTVVPDFISRFLVRHNSDPSAFDRFYLHQANVFILDKIRKKLGVDEIKLPDRVIRQFGNSSSGTLPMLVATEPSAGEIRALLCGFGVGLEWGAASYTFGDRTFRRLLEF